MLLASSQTAWITSLSVALQLDSMWHLHASDSFPIARHSPQYILDHSSVRAAAFQEIDSHCRQVIHDNHNWIDSWAGKFRPQPHLFGSVTSQVPQISWSPEDPFLVKLQRIRAQDLLRHQFCYAHGAICNSFEPVDVDFSGLPCQENSRANSGRLFQDGRHSDIYVTWAKKHTVLQTPLLILENTPDWKCLLRYLS